eukprot:399700_1
MCKNGSVYEFLIETKPNKKCIDQIEKDLCRSFRSKQMIEKYKHKLRRILIAYSNFNRSIPYTQGMNYIAAFTLKQYFEKAPTIKLIQDKHESKDANAHDIVKEYWSNCIEEQSFWTFVAIMSKICTSFCNDLVGFHKSVECFNKVFNYHGPSDLVSHLNNENVYMSIFTAWYHTLFTHPAMNENMGKRIWDIFIVEQMDFSIILKISYLILIRHKSTLMKMDFIQITEFCKSSKCFVFGGMDDHELIYRASKLQLNELYLKPIRNLKYVQVMTIDNEINNNKNINDERQNNNGAFLYHKLWSYFKFYG